MSNDETLGFSENGSLVDSAEKELLLNQASMIDKVIERETLNQQIEAFLNSGGRIDLVEANVMADPPKKPENKYGSQPI